jgi:hypothetical protein
LIFSKLFYIFKTEEAKTGGNIGTFGVTLAEMGVNIGICDRNFVQLSGERMKYDSFAANSGKG